MCQSRGPEVFGDGNTVDNLRAQLRQVEEILLRFGPFQASFLFHEDEEADERAPVSG
ncbi:hypothetical protein ACFV5G_12400 [Streptomyces sp. NPDC059766]|uniref:hypothetical protein n=1 Tax=Streptomyces sp. NPDC059766 TaxID=3346940 RepID=UPI003656E488